MEIINVFISAISLIVFLLSFNAKILRETKAKLSLAIGATLLFFSAVNAVTAYIPAFSDIWIARFWLSQVWPILIFLVSGVIYGVLGLKSSKKNFAMIGIISIVIALLLSGKDLLIVLTWLVFGFAP